MLILFLVVVYTWELIATVLNAPALIFHAGNAIWVSLWLGLFITSFFL
ncbi:MAG: hypothetical protein NTV49_13535 [Kiritimatiellaeota bacterium]|nr:hypothetical protein [Kiritimatiellota bacterium]